MKRTTVLLAEDHMIVREGLRAMLELDGGFEVVGEAQDGRAAVARVTSLRPDVVLMDIAMPHLNGLEATRQILKLFPETKVLILSAHNDHAYVDSAIEAGAKGFLLKQESSREVCQAIRRVQAGGTCFDPSIARRLDRHQRQNFGRSPRSQKRAATLTSREREVLQLIAEGRANKETAIALGIGAKTVEKHREHLMDKLDIHDTAGLTRYAIGAGIIESCVQVTIL